MKHKSLLLAAALTFIVGGTTLSAQGKYGADSAECIKYLSYYKEYYKQKNYDDALPNWRKAFKLCPPTANQTMLVDGTSLMRQLINKNRNNSIYRDALIDTLLTIHDLRIANYPKYATTALNNKGLDVINYIKDDPKELYLQLKDIIKVNKGESKPQFFLFTLNTACDMYQKGIITAEEVIADYEESIAYLDGMEPKSQTEKDQVNKIKEDVQSIFISSNIASCDNLIALFTPRFEANPNDIDLVTNIVKIMSTTEGCTDNDLFVNAANKMHELSPSSSSAYFLFRLYSGRNDVDSAVKYMMEAISSEESDNVDDSQYYLELADFCFRNARNAQAFEAALKAVELNAANAGKAYMLAASIWGSQVCKGNEIETRAPYWVAVDYLVKAKNADASFTEDANRLIAQYSAYFPQTAEAFMYNITKGESYTVSCGGMRAVTTVRTQD